MSGHIYITGDTHGDNDTRKLNSKNFSDGKTLDLEDYLIVAGDFGILWDNNPNNKLEEHLKKWYAMKGWTTLFVDGNHENHRRLLELPTTEMFGGKVGVVSDTIFHLKRGEVYTINNQTFFCFGGAMSVDRQWRVLGRSLWDEEIPSSKEMVYAVDKIREYHSYVDFVITHTCPESLVSSLGFSKGDSDPTRRFLDFIVREIKFKKWFCGHWHINKVIAGKYFFLYDEIMEII